MSVKIKSVKLMSVNNEVRQNIVQFQYRFFGISDLRLFENCLKMTAYDGIGGNESKTAFFIDT